MKGNFCKSSYGEQPQHTLNPAWGNWNNWKWCCKAPGALGEFRKARPRELFAQSTVQVRSLSTQLFLIIVVYKALPNTTLQTEYTTQLTFYLLYTLDHIQLG